MPDANPTLPRLLEQLCRELERASEHPTGGIVFDWPDLSHPLHLAHEAAKLAPVPAASVPDVEAEVCADILRRQAAGRAKYGQTVAENPLSLREWLNHSYEEALDFAIYLKRAMREIPAGPSREALRDAHAELQRKADAMCGKPRV